MTDDRDPAAGIDPSRHLSRALAALRDATEHLEDAAAASEGPSLSVATALSHVAAARKVLRSRDIGTEQGAAERYAA